MVIGKVLEKQLMSTFVQMIPSSTFIGLTTLDVLFIKNKDNELFA